MSISTPLLTGTEVGPYFLTHPRDVAELTTHTGRVIAEYVPVPGVDVTDIGSLRLMEVSDGYVELLSVEALRVRFELASRGEGLGPGQDEAYTGQIHAVVNNRVVPIVPVGNDSLVIDAHGVGWRTVILAVALHGGFGGAGDAFVGAFRYRIGEAS